MPRIVKKILPSITHILVAESSPALLSFPLWKKKKTASSQEFQIFLHTHLFLGTRCADTVKFLNIFLPDYANTSEYIRKP